MFCQLREEDRDELTRGDYLINMHKYSVPVETFDTDPKLKEFWDVTATSVAPGGQVFAATIEAKKYPIMATMFHPEKITQQWNDDIGLNHSWKSIELNRYFGDLFVKMARANKNSCGGFKDYQPHLIHNYDFYSTMTYTGDMYMFK